MSSSPALSCDVAIAMDRIELGIKLTCFQACARGFLVRREVRRAREDFEDIVKEIDGNLTHLAWRKTSTIPTPHFTDTQDGPLTQPCRPPNPGLGICTSPQRQPSLLPEEEAHNVQSERIEAERDEAQSKGQLSTNKDRFSISRIKEDGGSQITGGEMTESAGDSTTVWSSEELDMNCGTQQYHSGQEVPCTPEALRLHRNTLTMELLWLQQAIDSRKKYLSLKNRLSIS